MLDESLYFKVRINGYPSVFFKFEVSELKKNTNSFLTNKIKAILKQRGFPKFSIEYTNRPFGLDKYLEIGLLNEVHGGKVKSNFEARPKELSIGITPYSEGLKSFLSSESLGNILERLLSIIGPKNEYDIDKYDISVYVVRIFNDIIGLYNNSLLGNTEVTFPIEHILQHSFNSEVSEVFEEAKNTFNSFYNYISFFKLYIFDIGSEDMSLISTAILEDEEQLSNFLVAVKSGKNGSFAIPDEGEIKSIRASLLEECVDLSKVNKENLKIVIRKIKDMNIRLRNEHNKKMMEYLNKFEGMHEELVCKVYASSFDIGISMGCPIHADLFYKYFSELLFKIYGLVEKKFSEIRVGLDRESREGGFN